MTIDEVIKGLVTGVLATFVILYSLRPTSPYPRWVVESYEHPWIFVLMIIAVPFLYAWDNIVGALAFIITTMLIIDYNFFGKRSAR